MTTTNERDEELEKFIDKTWYKYHREDYETGEQTLSIYSFEDAFKDVAAFSARRATESMEKKVREAREKAIEECYQEILKNNVHFRGEVLSKWAAFVFAAETLKNLKSKTT